ncbi:MAG: response regulator [Gemmataceae bacterium]
MARILIVEDSPTQAEALRLILVDQGFGCEIATSAEAALEALRAQPVDLVLSDVIMPGITGYDLCRKIKSDLNLKALPVILLTTLSQPMDVIHGLESGADNFITKPYEPDYLIARVKSILANRALRADRKLQVGIDLVLMGRRVTITSEREQILDALLSTFEELMRSRERENESRLAEMTLRKSQEFLQSALDALTAHIAILEETGRIRAVNASWQHFAADCPLLGDGFGADGNYLERMERADEAQRPGQILEGIRAVLNRDIPEHVSEFSFEQDGSRRFYLVRTTAFPGLNERLAVVAHSEITERKLAEESLQQTIQELRFSNELIEQTTQAMGVANLRGRIIRFNQAFRRLTGYAETELLNMSYQDLTPGRWHEIEQSHVREALEGKKPVRYEKEYIRKDGKIIPVELTIEVYRDTQGAVECLYAFVNDISERKLAERRQTAQYQIARALAESRTFDEATPRLLKAIGESGEWQTSAVWMIDSRHQALRCRGFWSARDLPDDEFAQTTRELSLPCGVGLPGQVWSAGAPQWRPNFSEDPGSPRAAAAGRRGLHAAFGFPIRHGKEILGVFESFGDQSREPEESLLQMAGVIGSQVGQFIEGQRLEESYRQSQKMEAVGRLAGGVAHDFNNLLTVISGYSEILLTKMSPDNPDRHMLHEIKRASERSANLTSQLLAFSRKQILTQEILDLGAIVADMERMLGRILGEDLDLYTQHSPGLGKIKADRGQIEQIIMNLAINARDAMPTGGKLTIEARNLLLDEHYASTHSDVKPGEYVVLAMTDTGCGMDAATMQLIFEPFFTTKEPGKGTGLGLATVYGIVKQLGGNIEVYSEIDRGTTFKIYLPRVYEVAPLSRSKQGVPLRACSETIFLVEDDEDLRKLAKIILESAGFRVIEAAGGKIALQLLESNADVVHLLLTDVVMPDMSGRELAARVAELRPSIKVLFQSGYTDDAVIRHGILSSDMAFLQKPYSPTALVQKVRDVLDDHPRGQ